MKRNYILYATLFFGIAGSLQGQIDPLSAQYYNNRYLGNPSMAGFNRGYSLNGSYRQLLESFSGSPVSQSLSLDYGFERMGLGLNIFNDRSGLIRQTRAVGSFSYHVPVSGVNRLSFGLSLGLQGDRLSQGDIIGVIEDVSVVNYNSRSVYFDGDFGISYSDNRLIFQVSALNLRNLLKRDYALHSDVPMFYVSGSYKFEMANKIFTMVEPLVAYRSFSQIQGIVDLGFQFNLLSSQFSIMGMYHNNGGYNNSFTFGFGLTFKNRYLLSGMYTTGSSALSGYSNGNFELGLRYSDWK